MLTNPRFLALILAIYLTSQLDASAANTYRGAKLNERPLEQRDRIAQASETFGYNPYGNSYEAMHHNQEAGLISELPYIDPMSAAASYHHKKGTKGWLDMGAWTKKKGAFGWYADYPVGKGK